MCVTIRNSMHEVLLLPSLKKSENLFKDPLKQDMQVILSVVHIFHVVRLKVKMKILTSRIHYFLKTEILVVKSNRECSC